MCRNGDAPCMSGAQFQTLLFHDGGRDDNCRVLTEGEAGVSGDGLAYGDNATSQHQARPRIKIKGGTALKS